MSVGAIVLAGGLGSRLLPLTDAIPKPLLPLGPEPLIGYQLRRLAAVGIDRAVLATGHLAEQFSTALGDGRRFGLRLEYSVEDHPLGTGGALRGAAQRLPQVDTVVVLNGDLLSSHDLAAQLAMSRSAQVCLHVREVPDASAYGRVVVDATGRVVSFAEKSGHGPGLINAGTYIAEGELLRCLPPGPRSWERDVLPDLIDAGQPVTAFAADGYFRDVGTASAYCAASSDWVTGALPGSGSPASSYVAVGASVAPTAVLRGGSGVHAGACIERGAVLDSTVVLPGAHVGTGTRLTRCVVTMGTVVAAGTTAVDSVIGS